MEADSAQHINNHKSQREQILYPPVISSLQCKSSNDIECAIKCLDSSAAEASGTDDIASDSYKEKKKENLTKDSEYLKRSDFPHAEPQNCYGGQVVDRTSLSYIYNNVSSATYSFTTNSSCKPSNRTSTHRKITCERLRELKILVDKAVKENKTFTIQGSCPAVKNALRQRGWVEKRWNETRCTSSLHTSSLHTSSRRTRKIRPINDASFIRSSRSTSYSASLVAEIAEATFAARNCQDNRIEEEEENIMSRMLRNYEPALVWIFRSDSIEWSLIPKHQMVNRFPKTYFATKVGLCGYLQQMHWYYEAGISNTLFPRCYCVCLPDEMQAFRDDFRLTACLSMLKWLVSRYEMPKDSSKETEGSSEPMGVGAVQSATGKVPLSAIDFAIKRITEHVISCQHGDIDVPMSGVNSYKYSGYKTWDHQWDQFLTWFYQLVHEGKLLSCDSAEENCDKPASADVSDKEITTVKDLYERAKTCLNDVRPYWPQLDLDGLMNLWILKPGAKSRGRGIQLINRLESVNQKLSPAVMKETRYVIQKYIERPLLIYKTKFDIRQWFLVTNSYPLTIWMYKESYLRFSSQIFSLHKLHESIHLCNNAVQCRYTNGNDRDPALPDENMWDCYTFQTYLRTIGHANAWDDYIYPGMKESIIGALLASQDNMTDGGMATNATASFIRGKGCMSSNIKTGNRTGSYFELFGADFMLTEDYRPWLIEINSCPCMASSTSVTARMCPQCLEDVIKVVVDRRERKEADTGMFELAYKQHVEPPPPYTGVCLSVHGKQVQRSSKNEVAASGGLEPGDKNQFHVDVGLEVNNESQDEDVSIEISKAACIHESKALNVKKSVVIKLLEDAKEVKSEKKAEIMLADEECEEKKAYQCVLTTVTQDSPEPLDTHKENAPDEENGENEESEDKKGEEDETENIKKEEEKQNVEDDENVKDTENKEEKETKQEEEDREGTDTREDEENLEGKENVEDKENVEGLEDNKLQLESLMGDSIDGSLQTSPTASEDCMNPNIRKISSITNINLRDEKEVLNSIQLFQEWRKSLVYTRETCKGVLNQLKLFKEWHMHSREDFRERSQATEQSKQHKSKMMDRVPMKNKLRWKKALHKSSLDIYNSAVLNKSSLKGEENSSSKETQDKRSSREVDAKSSNEQHGRMPLSKTKQGLTMRMKRSDSQPSNLIFKTSPDGVNKYWNSMSNFKPRSFGTLTQNLMEAGSREDSKVNERQRNFLEHIAVLNRKRECQQCVVASNCDGLKRKAGFRPIEVTTFDPPFL